MLDRYFEISGRGATLAGEVRGGLTTFMVMAYIIFVNPAILTFAGNPALQGQGPPFAAVQAATCLVAAAMTVAMGLATNYPLALASGMGLNAVVAFQLVAGLKLPWPAAMGVVFLEGLAITALVLTGFREAIMNAIPLTLKRAIGVGIGLFILFIGLVSGGVVKPGPPGVPVTLGDLTAPPVAVAVFGLLLTLWLEARRVRGGLLIGILATTALAIVVNRSTGGTAFPTPGQAVLPASLLAWPDFSTLGAGLDLSVFARLGIVIAVMTIFSIMLSDFFDTMGTVIGIAGEAGWLDDHGKLPRLNRVLLVDSVAAVVGGAAGASSATTYVESAAGVAAGAKTGLASVVTGACFFLALFFAPLAGVVPPQATAAALIVVGSLMIGIVRDIPFGDLDEGFPALLTLSLMAFTYSITNGIGAGFVAYCFIKLVRGRARQVHPMMYIAAVAFVVYFAAPLLQRLLQ
ncbi:MAG TPA: NCS2 family permease [Methylomirabilota bacterium]|jgi:AGZA family xanthine/uracil permease-like MFS transporter|nr:NCS2 family permease [Methylomirabilota bacterium]